MLKGIALNKGARCIEGLPNGLATFFLADVGDLPGPFNFCAIIGPEQLLPTENRSLLPIAGAWVAHFGTSPQPALIDAITTGYKGQRGAFAVAYVRCAFGSSFECTIQRHQGIYSFEKHVLSPEKVLIDLFAH